LRGASTGCAARPAAPLALETAFGALITVEALGLLGLLGAAARPWVGAVGAGLASFAVGILGPVGGAIALIALFLVSGLVASEIGFGLVTTAWRLFVKAPARAVLEGAKERHAQAKARPSAGAAVAEPVLETSTAIEPARRRRPREVVAEAAPALAPEDAVPVAPRIVTRRPVTEGDALAAARREEAEQREARVREKEARALERAALKRTQGEIPLASEMADAAGPRHARGRGQRRAADRRGPPGEEEDAPLVAGMAGLAGTAAAARAMGAAAMVKQPEIPRVPYVPGDVPGLELLEDAPEPFQAVSEEELTAEAQLLTAKMLDFGITGRVTEVHPGPWSRCTSSSRRPVSRSRKSPAARTTSRSRCARADPHPRADSGKAAVGIEIPNKKPRTVYLKEVLASDAYKAEKGALKIVLGVDAGGNRSPTTSRRCPTSWSRARPARARASTSTCW
jgi:DNA segregation ATPase FtsK/SpoIIIE-like protein